MKFAAALLLLFSLVCAPIAKAGDMTGDHLNELVSFKKQVFGIMSFMTSWSAMLGSADPVLDLVEEESPPPVFCNFKIHAAKVTELAEQLDLPAGISLAPVQILPGDEPQYFLTVHVAKLSGFMSGIRAEWLVYVKKDDDPQETPFFMIVENRTSTEALNPVEITSAASRVEHGLTGGRIETVVGEDSSPLFKLSFPLSGNPVAVTRNWANAASRKYWKNGVFDRSFFTGNLLNGDVISVDPVAVTINDSTVWAAYVEPTPVSVLAFQNKLDYAVIPWSNIKDQTLPLSFWHRWALTAARKYYFGSICFDHARQVSRGEAKPFMHFTIAPAAPSLYLNYRIPPDKVAALSARLDLAGGLSLAKIRLLESQAEPQYFLTLYAYQPTGLGSLPRCEWFTYVSDGVSAKPRMLFVDVRSRVVFNPVTILDPATTVSHTMEGSTLATTIGEPDSPMFSSSLTVPPESERVKAGFTVEWIESNDANYWNNKVYEKAYYTDGFIFPELVQLDPAGVQINNTMEWQQYLEPAPEHVLLVFNTLEFVISPWYNLDELADEIGM